MAQMDLAWEAALSGQYELAAAHYKQADTLFSHARIYEMCSVAWAFYTHYLSDGPKALRLYNDWELKRSLRHYKIDAPVPDEAKIPEYNALIRTKAWSEIQSYVKDGIFATWRDTPYETKMGISEAIRRFLRAGGPHATLIPVYMDYGGAQFNIGNYTYAGTLFMRVVKHDTPGTNNHWVASYRAALCFMFSREWQNALCVLEGTDTLGAIQYGRARESLMSLCKSLSSTSVYAKKVAEEVLKRPLFTPHERALIRSVSGYPVSEWVDPPK